MLKNPKQKIKIMGEEKNLRKDLETVKKNVKWKSLDRNADI